jgi:hypothetical protein
MVKKTTRTLRFDVRLTEDERTELATAAETAGVPCARYVRELLTVSRLPSSRLSRADSDRITRELSRIGVNLNQVAKRLNSGERLDDPLRDELQCVLSDLSAALVDLR